MTLRLIAFERAVVSQHQIHASKFLHKRMRVLLRNPTDIAMPHMSHENFPGKIVIVDDRLDLIALVCPTGLLDYGGVMPVKSCETPTMRIAIGPMTEPAERQRSRNTFIEGKG